VRKWGNRGNRLTKSEISAFWRVEGGVTGWGNRADFYQDMEELYQQLGRHPENNREKVSGNGNN